MPRRPLLTAALALLAAAPFPGLAVAQDIAPPATPDPSACAVEPLPDDDVRAILEEVLVAPPGSFASPFARVPGPLPEPFGEPADDETVAAVAAAAEEWFACQNGESVPAILALHTEEAARGRLAEAVWSTDAAAALQANTPVPEVADALLPIVTAPFEGEPTALVAVRDVTVRDDGRVGAVLEWANPDEPEQEPQEIYAIFRPEGDRYLIDLGGLTIVESDEPPATPEA